MQEFQQLLKACQELSELCDEGLVFIGGVAVYLHTVNTPGCEELAETTHDGDFYVPLCDLADLRDMFEMSPNRRLSKHQLISHGFEFDVYTEHNSGLIIPYDVVRAHANRYAEFQVACLEHLLGLKLEAYRDRKSTGKGDKDARDLVQIAVVAAKPQHSFGPDLVLPYLDDEHIALMEAVSKSSEIVAMANGNAHAAKALRTATRNLHRLLDDAS